MATLLNRTLFLCGTCLVLVILASACAPAGAKVEPSPLPSPTRTATAIGIPEPTATPAPTPTSDALCSIPELDTGIHISASGSYTETQTEAAGPMICRIERGSCAYERLIGNLDGAIVFKREETPPYDEEDILMHPAMLGPLTRLNELVQQEWNGEVQLRVTDAYDSLLEHHLFQPDENKRVSLHFEGRAIDLTTYPVNRDLYGRLCALAHCAGFDWVHNEEDHCHAAISAPSLCLQC